MLTKKTLTSCHDFCLNSTNGLHLCDEVKIEEFIGKNSKKSTKITPVFSIQKSRSLKIELVMSSEPSGILKFCNSVETSAMSSTM